MDQPESEGTIRDKISSASKSINYRSMNILIRICEMVEMVQMQGEKIRELVENSKKLIRKRIIRITRRWMSKTNEKNFL